MTDHTPTPEIVIDHPEEIHGYEYGTDRAATSPLTLVELERLKAVACLTEEDHAALREAAEILADHVTVWTRAYVDDDSW